jgi:hypothetical protein
MPPFELDPRSAVRTAIPRELHDVIAILHIGTELSPVQSLSGGNPSDHLGTIC